MKLNKIYELRVQLAEKNGVPGDFLIIRPPISVEFSIDRHRFASSNKANIKIYNLSEQTRSLIFRDRFQNFSPIEAVGPTNQPRYVRFYAGYEKDGQQLSLIFSGAIFYGHSTRRGPDYITELECMDPDIYQYVSTSSFTIDRSVDKAEIIRKLYVDLVGDEVAATGIIGEFSGSAGRGQAILGPTIKILSQTTDGNFFIDLGRPISLLPGETFDNPGIRILSADSGLLNVPVKSDTQIIASLMFTPELQVGQKVIVNGYRDTQYNGEYVVVGIRHGGIISGTHDSQTTTQVSLYNGALIKTVTGLGGTNG